VSATWIKLADGTRWPDPSSEALSEAAHTARYGLATLTQSQAFHLCAAVEAYCHLATHPAGTESVVAQLRMLRRALKERQRVRALAGEGT